MIGKKINQLATELAPVSTDLTIIGDPISGVSKKITLAQLGAIFSGAVSFYNDLASFPTTGDINVIYCAKDTQKLYLWSGSAYTEVFPSQALLNTYQLRSEKGVSNGYASLDSGGKVPISQLPSSIMEYKGTWSAATNTPTLANGTGNTGDVYLCNAAGSVNFGAGPITFAVGDYVVYSGSIYQRSSGAVGTVTSVGLSITGDAIGVSNSPITTSGTLALAFAGTSGQYINGAGSLTTFPSLTGFVPYTGATGQVNLGAYDLLVQTLTIGKGNSGLSNNTALGYRTLFHITTGNYNTAVGYEAAHNTTTGQYNTALGQSALFTNTTGSQNTALGLNALLSNTTGGSNVVVGLDAMQHNTTGSSNTALGYNAGSHITGGSTPNTTASNSVYIGRDSKAKVDGGANEIVIGYNAIGNGSNTATFGNTSTTANYFTGSINGGSFVKSGGTSAQFLKADGSVDSNTYLTTSAASSTYLPLILNSSANTVDINGQQFTIQGSAGGFTSGRIIVDPVFSALGYQNSGVFDGLKILTNGNAEFTNSGITRFFNQVRFDSTLSNGTYTYTLPSATGTLALVGGAGVGTVTSVGLSSATSGVTIGSSPITTSGTITLAIATASGSQQGLLSSTDWTTFNNKQNALTNPVTGTGTTNYLPKFTGASTIGNSIISESGGVITIAGNLNVGSLGSLSINAGTAATPLLTQTTNYTEIYRRSGGVGIYLGGTEDAANYYDNTIHYFRTSGGGATRMTIDASGNLGLGVTPSAWRSSQPALQIGGYTSLSDISGYTQLGNNYYTNSSNQNIYINSYAASIYAQNNGQHQFFTAPSGTAGNAISFTQAMTLDASGRLAVGTTSIINDNLLPIQINAGTSSQAYFASNNNGSYGLLMGYDNANGYARIRNVSNTALTFETNNTERLRIASTGAATFSSSVTAAQGTFTQYTNSIIDILTLYNISATSAGVRQRFQNGFGDLAAISVSQRDNGALADDGQMQFQVASNSVLDTKMTILNTGSVGIGTTSPGGKFDVATGTGATLRVIFGGTNILNVTNYSATDGFREFLLGGSELSFYSGTAGAGSLSERMRITSGGNVGIGTTSPTFKLQVNGTVSNTNNRVFGTNGLSGYLIQQGDWIGTAATNLSIAAETGNGISFFTNGTGDVRMFINTSGNVGIGTTSPAEKLDVYGNLRLFSAGYPYIDLGVNTSNYWRIINDNPNDTFVIQKNGATKFTLASSGSATFTSNSTINGSGVDILLVSGNSSTNTVRSTSVGGAASRFINIVSNVTENSNQVDIRTHGSTYTETLFGNSMTNAGAILGQPAAGAPFVIGNYNNGALVLGTNNAERMRITSGGNVLIGTTSDAGDKLQVNGFVTVTNRVLAGSAGNTSNAFSGINNSTAQATIYAFNHSASGYAFFSGQGINYFANNVGINTTNPTQLLDVNGTARFGSAIVASLGTGLVYSSGGTLTSTNPSDQRLKNTIKALSYGLNEILQLNPKTFYYNDDVNKERLKYGFIAQEVKGIMPELARKLNAETDYLGLETEGIYVTLVNAIKELKAELDTLKNK